MHSLLSDIGLSIIFAAVLGGIFYRLKLPMLLAYLLPAFSSARSGSI